MGKNAKTRRKSNIPRKLNNKHIRDAVKTREERMYARMLKEKEKEKEEGKKKIQIVDVDDARNSSNQFFLSMIIQKELLLIMSAIK